MKKFINILLCISIILCLTSCGDIHNVKTHNVSSSIYTEKDIESAIKEVKKIFYLFFDCCTLTEIYYAGDETTIRETEYQNDHLFGKYEVIVLESTFITDSNAEKALLVPNEEYGNYNWILIRKPNGKWHHQDHGYG